LLAFLSMMTLWVTLSTSVRAHEVLPTIVDLVFAEDGALTVSLDANAEALLSGIGAEHDDTDDAPQAARYDALRALPADALRDDIRDFAPTLVDGIAVEIGGQPVPLTFERVEVPPVGNTDIARKSIIEMTGRVPGSGALDWRFDEGFGASVLRLRKAGESDLFHSVYVQAGDAASVPLGDDIAPQTAFDAFLAYIPVGFDHIVPKGLDHILFVIGLFLLNTRLGPLLWQVTAFTLAHTITLALASLGYVNAPPSIVEPLIAASIVFVAVENMMTDRLGRWRLALIFGFGLLHGLGFAGVLSEFGLPQNQFIPGLIGFNIGVELGQLAVIAACYLAVGLWFSDKPWYRRFIVIPASAAIAVIAAYWFFERIGVLG
jgi:hypothetical protein